MRFRPWLAGWLFYDLQLVFGVHKSRAVGSNLTRNRNLAESCSGAYALSFLRTSEVPGSSPGSAFPFTFFPESTFHVYDGLDKLTFSFCFNMSNVFKSSILTSSQVIDLWQHRYTAAQPLFTFNVQLQLDE